MLAPIDFRSLSQRLLARSAMMQAKKAYNQNERVSIMSKTPKISSQGRELQPSLGRRAANKLDKVKRIRKAAAELFSSRGFDDTTMREIAARSKVALGTLFLYASNKRDLLFLIANEVMESTRLRATRSVSETIL